MLYTGSALEQQELQAMPLADAKPRPNRRVRSINWPMVGWTIILTGLFVLTGWSI